MIDTVFLIGTGAQHDPWKPVINGIQKCGIEGIGNRAQVTCPESANSFFATLVSFRRHMEFQPSKKLKKSIADVHTALKRSIAAELAAATAAGAIGLRLQFREISAELGIGSTVYLTTNWDLLLANALSAATGEKSRAVYLHGNVEDPDLMLLPGETIDERYRSPAHRRAMKNKLALMSGIINRTRRLVVYGHSVSPVEAELRLALCVGLGNAPPGEIVIVNLPSEIDAVRRRLLPLLPQGRAWKITPRPVDPPRPMRVRQRKT